MLKLSFNARLVGDQDQMSLLADVILRKIHDGQDRVRKLSIYQLTLCLRKIMELGLEDRPSMTAELCEKTLGVTTQREEHHTEECRNRREATIAELSRI
jgi:hypothetical protein